MIDEGDDPYLWLEDLDGAEAAQWVRDRNAETVTALTGSQAFAGLQAEIRQVLDADDCIPFPGWRGDHFYYDFWQDAKHPRGTWRRRTLDQYRRREPEWDVLLDVDALAADEGENWVWSGVTVLRAGHRRCLISLSRGGADAVMVREFDLDRRAFVEDGFMVAEAKTTVCWIDADHIYVGTDTGPGSLTTSGYPRIVKRWQRGTPLSEAEVVYEASVTDVAAWASHDPTPGFERDFVGGSLDFFRAESFLLTEAGERIRIPVPEDAAWDAHREWLVIRPRSPWTVGEATYPAGTLLGTRFDAFLAGERELTVLFRPDRRTSLSYHVWTCNHLILATLADVRSRLEVLTPGETGWRRTPLPGVPDDDHSWVVDTDPDLGDAYLLASEGFLQPPSLRLGHIGGPVEILKRAPAFFDADGLAVRQFFATSADGTRVPYFVVGGPGGPSEPALLTGYGGYELSMTPDYDGIVGRGWLSRGGTYVVANVRGGGEYGPDWHRAAMRENRPRAYEDFAAVAADLVTRGDYHAGAARHRGPQQRRSADGGDADPVPVARRRRRRARAAVRHAPPHRLLAGASWMAEYGNPDREEDWRYLREYSPYHNVRGDLPYPPVLLVTSTRDDRVHPGHARKMAARLREHGHDVSYYENVDGDHGAAANNEQRAFIEALALEFLWQRLTGGRRVSYRGNRLVPTSRSGSVAGKFDSRMDVCGLVAAHVLW